MKDKHKKQVSADIPFTFLNGLGHDTRAMERFFDLPRETQQTLTDAVSTADDPDTRARTGLQVARKRRRGLLRPVLSILLRQKQRQASPKGRLPRFCSLSGCHGGGSGF